MGLKPKEPTHAKACIEYAALSLSSYPLEKYNAGHDTITTWDDRKNFLKDSVPSRQWELYDITRRLRYLMLQPGQSPSDLLSIVCGIDEESELAQMTEDERKAWHFFHSLDQQLQNDLFSGPNEEAFQSRNALERRA